jgi:hypothetical protein
MTAPRLRRRMLRAALVAGLGLCVPASAQAAEQFAALTSDNQIVLFRSDSPGNLQGAAPVSGLQMNEILLGLDLLPATGRLYALGSSNRIYAVNPVTGVATAVSNTPFSPPLNGQSFAFAIDPVSFEARVVSNSGQNLRVSVANGQVAGVDQPYAYVAGDPGQGATPALSALAYTQPQVGGGFASLYGVDTSRDVLVSSATNAATVRTLGTLNVDAGEPATLDVTSGGTAYAALRVAGAARPSLYTVDLSTGAAAPVSDDPARATIAYRTSSTATANTPVTAMTSIGPAADDETSPRVSIAVSSTQLASRLLRGGLQFTLACNEACSTTATLTVGREAQEPVNGAVLATAGNARVTIRLDAAARALLRRDNATAMRLRVVTTDAAGNRVATTRQIRGRAG